MIKRIRLLLLSIVIMLVAEANLVYAEEHDSHTIITVSASDANPLERIKEELIAEKATQNLLKLENIDIENSSISINSFNRSKVGFNLADVSITLSYHTHHEGDEKEEGINSIAYSFTETILIDMQASDSPTLLLSEDKVTVKEKDTFDPMEYISYLYDQSRVLPMIEIENPVDTSTPGEYIVAYTASNPLGKKTTASLHVIVEKKKPGFHISLDEIQFADDASITGMLDAINAVRAANGLYAYELADELGQTAAALRAQEATYHLAHSRPDGRSYITAFDDVGAPHGIVYEILVAYGSSIESNLNWWLNEPGHARIVLGTMGTRIAIGYQSGIWVAEVY